MNDVYAALARTIPPRRLLKDAPMRDHTTMRVGGPADVLADAAGEDDVRAVLAVCRACGAKLTVIGNGSNLLVRDGGIRGVVLRVGRHMADIRVQGEQIEAQAGATLSALAQAAARANLAGVAALSGIPGTLGGAAVMNAGAYGGEMSQVVQGVCALDGEGRDVRLDAQALDYGYRRSALMGAGLIVTRVRMRLTPGDGAALLEEMTELARRRREKQPLDWPSAGSTFKRPAQGYAAQLIDEAGLRGLRVGGAQVSQKHTGFIVNAGGATARDVLELMARIQQAVFERSGVRLEPEVRILGEE